MSETSLELHGLMIVLLAAVTAGMAVVAYSIWAFAFGGWFGTIYLFMYLVFREEFVED